MKPSPFLEFQQLQNTVETSGLENGKRLVVAASADNGEYYSPVRVYNLKQAKTMFGSGALLEAAEIIFDHYGEVDLFLVRMEKKIYLNLFKCLRAIEFDLIYIDEPLAETDEETLWSFIEMAKEKENHGQLIEAGLNIPIDQSNLLTRLKKTIQGFTFESDVYSEEYGKYLSMVMDQAEGGKTALHYVAWLAANEPEVNPVNKTFDVELSKEYTKSEIYDLRQSGFVCFRQSILKGVVCASSTTACQTSGSVHKDISNYRIVQIFISDLCQDLQSLVGEMNPGLQALKAKEATDVLIKSYKEMERITQGQYTFDVDELSGVIDVKIDLVPIFTTFTISAKASVRLFR